MSFPITDGEQRAFEFAEHVVRRGNALATVLEYRDPDARASIVHSFAMAATQHYDLDARETEWTMRRDERRTTL